MALTFTLPLPTEAATRALAARLAALLGPGDTVLLHGPIGAGKTALARALIQSAQARAGVAPEEVPSPSFTLVQTYGAGALEIWHADLYRLSCPDEVLELGLDEAFEAALCLVEWPDRLGSLAPAGALTLTLAPGTTPGADPHARTATFSFADPAWGARLAPILPAQVPHGRA